MDNVFSYSNPKRITHALNHAFKMAKTLQQQFFDQRQENPPPSLSFQQFNKHFKDSPSHLHISYMGTRTHAIDLVVTRNENGLFITVCNRGERGDHNIFETYPCSKSANFEEQHKTLNQVLNAAYTAEKPAIVIQPSTTFMHVLVKKR